MAVVAPRLIRANQRRVIRVRCSSVNVNLPRGPDRTRVVLRDREYTLRGSESRTLATVGAFRVVPAGDLRDGQGRPLDPRSGDLRSFREQGLVSTIPAPGQDSGWSSANAGKGGRGPDPRLAEELLR